MSTVSCVIVSHNNMPFLRTAVESVLAQTRGPEEIIIADDLSSDDSREYLEQVSSKYPRIRLILRESNLGVTQNRDLAIREATGDLITTLDGDDWYLLRKIECELRAIDSRHDRIGFSSVRLADEAGTLIGGWDPSPFTGLDRIGRLRWLTFRSHRNPRDMMFSRQLFLEMGGFNAILPAYEDWDLKIRLAATETSWVHSGVDGMVHRLNPSGISANPTRLHVRDRLRVLDANRALLKTALGAPSFAAARLKVYWYGIKAVGRSLAQHSRPGRSPL